MHSGRNIRTAEATGLSSEQDKERTKNYIEYITGVWLAAFINTYIFIIVNISRRMAFNLLSSANQLQASKPSANHLHASNFSTNHIQASVSPSTNQKEGFIDHRPVMIIPKISLDACERSRSEDESGFSASEFRLENITAKPDFFTFSSMQKFPSSELQSTTEKSANEQHCGNPGKHNNPSGSESSYSGISPVELVQLLNNEDKVLLLDCRAFTAFNQNHINSALNVSCADRITKKRLTDGKISISDVISGHEGKEMYRQLEREAVIVLYDEVTEELAQMPPSNPLKLVTECLRKSGLTARFLQGGLQAFQQCYSALCSQPADSSGVPLLYSPTSPEISCDIDSAQASQILDHLFIGNQRDASSRESLAQLGVTHVLNVTSNLPCSFKSDSSLVYRRLAASDSCSQNLREFFPQAINFIEEARSVNGKVLVHCQAGVSRSPSIVIAYLMSTRQLTLTEAFQRVKDQRSIIAPNLNFMGQLLEFEQQAVRKEGLRPPSEPLHLLRI